MAHYLQTGMEARYCLLGITKDGKNVTLSDRVIQGFFPEFLAKRASLELDKAGVQRFEAYLLASTADDGREVNPDAVSQHHVAVYADARAGGTLQELDAAETAIQAVLDEIKGVRERPGIIRRELDKLQAQIDELDRAAGGDDAEDATAAVALAEKVATLESAKAILERRQRVAIETRGWRIDALHQQLDHRIADLHSITVRIAAVFENLIHQRTAEAILPGMLADDPSLTADCSVIRSVTNRFWECDPPRRWGLGWPAFFDAPSRDELTRLRGYTAEVRTALLAGGKDPFGAKALEKWIELGQAAPPPPLPHTGKEFRLPVEVSLSAPIQRMREDGYSRADIYAEACRLFPNQMQNQHP